MTKKTRHQQILDYEVSSRTLKGSALNFGVMFSFIAIIIFAVALIVMGLLSFILWEPHFFFPWLGVRTTLAISAVLGVWFAIDMMRE